MLSLAIQGMPLGGGLVEASEMYAEEIHAITAAKVTSLGTDQSSYPAMIWATMYVMAALALIRPPALRRATLLLWHQWPIVILLVMVPFSAIWSPNGGKVLMNFVHALGVTFIAISAALHYRSNPRKMLRVITSVLIANLSLHLAAVLLVPAVGVSLDGRWAGLTGQSNTLGCIAYCLLWASSVGIQISKGERCRLLWLGILLSVVVLIGSNSVTSIVASGIVLLVSFLYGRVQRGRLRFSVLSSLALMGAVCAALFVLVLGPSDVLEYLTGSGGRSSDLSGRTYIWLAALDLIDQYPILGWGFDDNARVILETGMPHTTYHNGYLDIAVRGGTIALVLLLAMVGRFFLDLRRLGGDRWFPTSLSFIVAMLIYNLSETALLTPRNILWICLLVLSFTIAEVSMLSSRRVRRKLHHLSPEAA
jgi:O-antigen ligase